MTEKNTRPEDLNKQVDEANKDPERYARETLVVCVADIRMRVQSGNHSPQDVRNLIDIAKSFGVIGLGKRDAAKLFNITGMELVEPDGEENTEGARKAV